MNSVRLFALTLACSLFAANAMAADPPKPRTTKKKAAAEALFMRMDVTKNGSITRELWVKHGLAIEVFTAADTNKDGKFDRREFLIAYAA